MGSTRGVSEVAATVPNEITEPTNSACLRWDLYKEIGYPEIHTLEDLLPILKQMQELEETSESGQKYMAFSLFSDWDSDIMHNAGALSALYGYDPQGFALFNIVTGETQSMIADDSFYVRGLKFLFDANQLGLVDPESTTQNLIRYRQSILMAPLFIRCAMAWHRLLQQPEKYGGRKRIPVSCY